MTKEKKYMIIEIFILMITLVGGIGTYAWFTWKSTNNTSLTMSIGKLADVIFTSGNDISTSTLAPVYNYTDGEKTTFSINNKDTSGATIDYNIKLNITSIATELKSTDLKYVLLKNNVPIKEGNFSTVVIGSTTIYSDSITSSGVTNFTFYLYIDGNEENNLNMINKTLSGTITVEATEKKITSIDVLNSLNLKVNTGTPDFSKSNEEDGTNGIYSAEDDLGTTYYFRGDVDNNFVYFADYYWRIIRVNGNGTIRMIYSSKLKVIEPSPSGIDVSIYNSEEGDNTYVGYMTGTPGASTYEKTHSNSNDSLVKSVVDAWYDDNLLNYESYIADAIYCNDRSVYEGTGIGTDDDTVYSSFERIRNSTPTFKCTNKNDRFTKSTTLGNGKLTRMVGLITIDEVMYAGATENINKNYYLYAGEQQSYYNITMTPIFIDGMNCTGYSGGINQEALTYEYMIRPVISLKGDAITGGNGTIDTPFTVG